MSKRNKDALERVAWTAVQSAAGAAAVARFDLPPLMGVLVATLIAAVKTVAAKHVGNPDTAALGGGL